MGKEGPRPNGDIATLHQLRQLPGSRYLDQPGKVPAPGSVPHKARETTEGTLLAPNSRLSLTLFLDEIHDPILGPVRIFSVARGVNESAMAPVARSDHPNLRMALNQRPCEHGIGDERIVLRCDDEGGNGKGLYHMVCPGSLVVVGTTGVPSVRGGIAVIEVPHPGDASEVREIPLVREERGLSPQAGLQFSQKASVVHPVAGLLQGFDALRGINSRADRDHAGQCCL